MILHPFPRFFLGSLATFECLSLIGCTCLRRDLLFFCVFLRNILHLHAGESTKQSSRHYCCGAMRGRTGYSRKLLSNRISRLGFIPPALCPCPDVYALALHQLAKQLTNSRSINSDLVPRESDTGSPHLASACGGFASRFIRGLCVLGSRQASDPGKVVKSLFEFVPTRRTSPPCVHRETSTSNLSPWA